MKEIIDCSVPEKLLNLGLVFKNAVFLHNFINIILRKLITEFIYCLAQYVPVMLKFTISELHSLVKLFIII